MRNNILPNPRHRSRTGSLASLVECSARPRSVVGTWLALAITTVASIGVGEAQLCPNPMPPCNGKFQTCINPYCCTETVTTCTIWKAAKRLMPGGGYCYGDLTAVETTVGTNCGYVEGTGTPVCY